MVGMKVKDGEAEDCIMEVYVPYSLTLKKSYDRFQFLEKLVVNKSKSDGNECIKLVKK